MVYLLLVLIAVSVSALAQEPAPAQQPAPKDAAAQPSPLPKMRSGLDPAAPARVGVGITERKLSLADAVAMALDNNLEIEIEETNRDTAEESIQAARGLFDPTFRWAPLLQANNTPTPSVLQGPSGKLTDRLLAQNFYLRQKVQRSGSQLYLDFENSRQTTNNPFFSFTPLQTSRLAFGFTQPLIRGYKIDQDRAEIRIRQKQADVSKVDLEIRVIDVVSRVEQAYWDLVAARQDVAVQESATALAREQHALNQRLVKSGTLAPIELSASEAELQRRLDAWYSSLGTLTEVENTLKTLLASDRSDPLWSDQLVPSEDRSFERPDTSNVRAAVETALKQRPELRSLAFRREANDVQKELNANLQKPEINFVAEYSLNGLGGTLRPGENPFTESNRALYAQIDRLSALAGIAPLPPQSIGDPPGFLVGSYGTALSNLSRYQSFQVGLSFDMNLRNRTANANYAQSLIGEKRLRLERARSEQMIEAQVRNALQQIQTARQRVTAADASANAAKEKLDSETRLFESGESTNFLVLTRQNDYADALRRAVVARLDFNKSVSLLEQALGTTLASYNIVLQ